MRFVDTFSVGSPIPCSIIRSYFHPFLLTIAVKTKHRRLQFARQVVAKYAPHPHSFYRQTFTISFGSLSEEGKCQDIWTKTRLSWRYMMTRYILSPFLTAPPFVGGLFIYHFVYRYSHHDSLLYPLPRKTIPLTAESTSSSNSSSRSTTPVRSEEDSDDDDGRLTPVFDRGGGSVRGEQSDSAGGKCMESLHSEFMQSVSCMLKRQFLSCETQLQQLSCV